MTMWLSAYRKFIVALGAVLAQAVVVIDDGITAKEWLTIAVAFVGALGVYAVPNAISRPIPDAEPTGYEEG